jgi:hypothetical protein
VEQLAVASPLLHLAHQAPMHRISPCSARRAVVRQLLLAFRITRGCSAALFLSPRAPAPPVTPHGFRRGAASGFPADSRGDGGPYRDSCTSLNRAPPQASSSCYPRSPELARARHLQLQSGTALHKLRQEELPALHKSSRRRALTQPPYRYRRRAERGWRGGRERGRREAGGGGWRGRRLETDPARQIEVAGRERARVGGDGWCARRAG